MTGPPEPNGRSGARPVPQFVELALYLDSASAGFGRLRSNLAVSSSAALGLLASMILLWLRFPHYVRGKQLERQTELARQVQTDLLPAARGRLREPGFRRRVCPRLASRRGLLRCLLSRRWLGSRSCWGTFPGKGCRLSVVAGLLLGAVRASAWMAGQPRTRSVFKSAQRTPADANLAGSLCQFVLVLLRTGVAFSAIRERRPSASRCWSGAD